MRTRTILVAAALMIGSVSFATINTNEIIAVAPVQAIEYDVTTTDNGEKLVVEFKRGPKKELMIMLFDEEGNKVGESLLKPVLTTVDIKKLKKGNYFYRIMTSSGDAAVGYGKFEKK